MAITTRSQFIPDFFRHRGICRSGGNCATPSGPAGAAKNKLQNRLMFFLIISEELLEAKKIVPEQVNEQMNSLYDRLGTPDLPTLGLRIAKVNLASGQFFQVQKCLYLLNEAIAKLPAKEAKDRFRGELVSLYLGLKQSRKAIDFAGEIESPQLCFSVIINVIVPGLIYTDECFLLPALLIKGCVQIAKDSPSPEKEPMLIKTAEALDQIGADGAEVDAVLEELAVNFIGNNKKPTEAEVAGLFQFIEQHWTRFPLTDYRDRLSRWIERVFYE